MTSTTTREGLAGGRWDVGEPAEVEEKRVGRTSGREREREREEK